MAEKNINKYSITENVTKEFEIVRAKTDAELRYLEMKGRNIDIYQTIASYIIFDTPFHKKIKNKSCQYNQCDLWKYGISGDLPIITITIKYLNDVYVIKEVLKMYEYLRTKNLKTELNISDAFVVENKSNIQKFIYEGGAEIMTSFLNRQPKKKEEIRRIVNAELLGKFMELKYHGGDLGREIAFPIKRDTEEIWKEKLLRVDCGWEIWEEDSLLPVMQIGEVPLRSCISYRNGPNCDCLLSCFDANKKIIFIKHNGKIVFRAILRLTKGSFVAADERKTIEFVDVTVKSEPHENKAEELVLFLERYYQSGLSEQEIRKAVNLTAMLVKEKAEKLGARLVLSSSYKNVLENKNYVLTNFYMYISASKNGSQYLDSLGGVAGVSASGSYTCNTFLLEAEERREESL